MKSPPVTEELPPNGVLLLYISADGLFPIRPQPEDTGYDLGGVLMAWALAYPMLLPQGPANPVGCLGAGLILWCGALYSLRGSWQRPVVQ